MRRLLPVLVLVVVVLAAGCSAFGVRSSDAATVNGVAISNDQLKEMVQAQLGQQQAQQQQQQQQQQSLDIEGITRQSLEGLIQYQLVLEGARKAGVSIQEGDVDARLRQLKAQAAAQGTNFEEALRAQNISEKVVRDQLRIQLAVDLVGVKLVPYASDAELRQALDKRKKDFLQVHVRHVLVKDAGTAASVRKQLVGSGDWGAVAKKSSTDEQTKNKGGDLGYISKGQTAPAFEKVELDLANQGNCKGKTSGSCSSPISQPVKTQFGFHVLQVTGVRLPALDNNLRSQLQPAVKEQRQAAIQKWFEGLVKQADVSINPRFGRWDKGSGKVVDRETAPGSATSTTVPAGGAPVGP